ncbi:Bestrophin, RFP-TM, chloride channel [Anatilimnocola aggregata]|uniref:Bestrophin, RFP-TM, chloride channel n=1 Tax=Anatilimnocola aggregata TaxID=2528021 RepID=A0A517YJP0_9BACT|nr:bestrophin family protein [Anatilimnocola aggregata]QDU30435.1 Bestrophin, RFP-TM, chloride channel [Anatilimnocola aggregata]
MIEYDPHNWRSHLLDIRGSLLPEIVGRVATCVGWSVIVTVAHEFLDSRYQISLAVPVMVHTLVGTALGLLLVFRTNASYDKFWEGRKLWGGMVNECRNIARQANALLGAAPELRKHTILWTAAFPYAAMSALRGTRGLSPSSSDLPKHEVEEVLAAQHLPSAITAKITAQILSARDQQIISDYLVGMVDHNINLLIDYIGACERIHRTPVPYAYVVHLRRALFLYCLTIPFAMVGDLHWWTIGGTFMVAYIFFGIEEIGVEIEDPFGFDENDLPLERYCHTIEANLLAVLNSSQVAAPVDATGDGR